MVCFFYQHYLYVKLKAFKNVNYLVYPREISKRVKVGSLVCFLLLSIPYLNVLDSLQLGLVKIMDWDCRKVSSSILIIFLLFLVVSILKHSGNPEEEEREFIVKHQQSKSQTINQSLVLKLGNVLDYFKLNSHIINLDSFITLAFSQSR